MEKIMIFMAGVLVGKILFMFLHWLDNGERYVKIATIKSITTEHDKSL